MTNSTPIFLGSRSYRDRWAQSFPEAAKRRTESERAADRLAEHNRRVAEHGKPVPVSERAFLKLPEYSCTEPTGPRIEMRWKRDANEPRRYHDSRKHSDPKAVMRDFPPKWLRGEVIPGPTLDTHTIIYRPIVVLEGLVLYELGRALARAVGLDGGADG